MLLTFSKKEFESLIKQGVKIHTIREDKNNRWKVGNKIHFWLGNPRNVKANPYQFGEGICSLVLAIHIYPNKNRVIIDNSLQCPISFKTADDLNEFAKNDGFDNWEDMKRWFKDDFHGKIIYWKDCRWALISKR